MNTKILVLLIFIITGLTANAQKISESKVPQDVLISYKFKFPDATTLNWELNKEIYTVRFKLNDQEGKAEFTEKGVWNLTRYPVSEKELPSTIISHIRDNYKGKGYEIAVSELQKNSAGKNFYFLLLKKEDGNQQYNPELTFDLSGKLLTKSNIEEVKTTVVTDKEIKDKDKDKDKNKKNEGEKTTVVKDEWENFKADPAKIPVTAKNHFASKIKKPTGVVWYLKEKIYTVKYMIGDKKGQTTYSKDGNWIESRLDQDPETLHQLAADYIKNNYRGYKIISLELVTQTKDKSLFVKVVDKKNKETNPPAAEIWFSTTGKFLSETKPDIPDPDDANFDKRIEEEEGEFLSKVDNKPNVYENADNYNEKVNFKELPTPIHQYLKTNYKDHLVRDSRLVTDDELGNVYMINAKLEAQRYGVFLYFDITGKFLRKIDEAESKMKGNTNKTPVVETEKQGSKYGTPDEVISTSDIPEDIIKHVRKNFPQNSIAEAFLKTTKEYGNCYLIILNKEADNKITKVFYDLDGNFLKNEPGN